MKPDDPGETPGACELQAQEEEEAKVDSKEQQQKLVMLHMAEPGQTLVQEAYGEASLSGSELQQITIPFSGAAEYSIIAPISEEIQAPATLYRSAVWEEWGGGGTSGLQSGGFSGEERKQTVPDLVLSNSEEESPVETSHTVVVSGAVMTEEALKDHSNHYIMSSSVPGSQFQAMEVRI